MSKALAAIFRHKGRVGMWKDGFTTVQEAMGFAEMWDLGADKGDIHEIGPGGGAELRSDVAISDVRSNLE